MLLEAQALLDCGDRAAARAALETSDRASRASAPIQHDCASLFGLLGLYEASLAAATRAVALDPHRPEYHFNRAATLRILGRIDDSECAYDRAIELRASDHEAWLNRSELRKQTLERNHSMNDRPVSESGGRVSEVA